MKRCPRCGGTRFFAEAHVEQDWIMDEYGDCVECNDDCVQVVHFPDDEQIWECCNCHYCADGKKFNIDIKLIIHGAEREIQFDDSYYDIEQKQIVYYFIAPAQLIKDIYPGKYDNDDVQSTEIRIALSCVENQPINYKELETSYCQISPTKDEEGIFFDYDWTDYDLSWETIDSLADFAEEQIANRKA